MKTQIIQLEAHDDTLSVRDKMDWSQTPRVLLVWPQSGKVLRNRLDLILLERYCSSHGSQLALLTTDPQVVYQADQAGIPVFQSRRQAQLQPWGKSFREFQRQELQRYKSENLPPPELHRDPPPPRKRLSIWARIPIFTLGVLAVLAIAATLLPNATIQIPREINARTLAVPFQAEPGGKEIGISGTVPGRALVIDVNAQLSRETTGTAAIPAEYARGKVEFTNLGEESILIPADTILNTRGPNPVLFRTLAEEQTPPGRGERIIVEIEAIYPGENGNVAEGEIVEISLEAGAELSLTNPEPTSGGTDLLIPAPSQVDRAVLSRQLNNLLQEKAAQEIAASLDSGDFSLTEEPDQLAIIEESYSPDGGSPGDTLWLDRTARFQAYYVSGEDLLALSRELVQAQYQAGPVQADLDSIQVETLTTPARAEDQKYHWQEQISWQESLVLNPAELIPIILGRKPAQAAELIREELALEDTPSITIQPKWWPRLPVLPFRVHILEGGFTNDQ